MVALTTICHLFQVKKFLPRQEIFKLSNSGILVELYIQKQPSRRVLKKRCSEKIQKIHTRTSMPSVISIKLLCNFIEIVLPHGCSPINLMHIFRTPFPETTSGWLLLYIKLVILDQQPPFKTKRLTACNFTENNTMPQVAFFILY